MRFTVSLAFAPRDPQCGALLPIRKRISELEELTFPNAWICCHDLGSAVKMARERALEGQLLNTYADMAFKMAATIAEGDSSNVTASDFMRALRRQFVYGSDPDTRAADSRRAFDWVSLGRSTGALLPFAAQRDTLLPSLRYMPPRKKQRKQPADEDDGRPQEKEHRSRLRSRNAQLPEERPNELQEASHAATKNKGTDIDQHLEHVYNSIKNEDEAGCHFVNAVGNSANGFAEFIENAFALSHLVKSGWCTMNISNEQLLAKARQEARPDEQSATRHAFVLSFNVDEYESVFGETEDREVSAGGNRLTHELQFTQTEEAGSESNERASHENMAQNPDDSTRQAAAAHCTPQQAAATDTNNFRQERPEMSEALVSRVQEIGEVNSLLDGQASSTQIHRDTLVTKTSTAQRQNAWDQHKTNRISAKAQGDYSSNATQRTAQDESDKENVPSNILQPEHEVVSRE